MRLILLLLPIIVCDTNNYEEFKKKTAAGFFFSMPRALQSGRNETVCITTHFGAPSTATIDLKLKDKHFFTTKLLTSDHTCFEMHVPQVKKEPQTVSVRVQVKLNTITYSSHNQDPIVIHPKKQAVFVQTDRNVYKSGDKLKFRVLILDRNMLPPPEGHKIAQVVLKNPLDVAVFAWENITTELGLAQLEHQLSKDALEGKWLIQVNESPAHTKIFEVTRYILPRFNVQILHPEQIFYKTPEAVSVKICSHYTYGASVEGSVLVRLVVDYSQPLEAGKKLKNGCADFSFSKSELFQDAEISSHDKVYLQITATVTEYGTDKIELARAKSLLSFKPFTLKFSPGANLFQPGHLYRGILHVENANVDLRGEIVEICYNLAIKKSWNYLNNEQCSNFTLKSGEKSVRFEILPLKSNVIHLHLNSRSFNHSLIADSALLVRLYSPSSSYILIEQVHAKCRTNQQFLVQFTAEKMQEQDNITFYYIVKSRGQIYKLRKTTNTVLKNYPNYESDKNVIGSKHNFVRAAAAIHEFVLKFKLDERITSPYQLLVYYISSSGEIVAGIKLVELEPCTNNAIRAEWMQKQVGPGERVELVVQTSSRSLCALSAVDKSLKFINQAGAFTKTELFQQETFLQEERVESGRKTCLPPPKKNKDNAVENEGLQQSRTRRFVHSYSEDSDANDIFASFGTVSITNYKTVTKLCYTGPQQQPQALPAVQSLTDQYDEKLAPHPANNVIRSHFPETWLWELVPVNNSAKISRQLPHTITNWATDVFCVSQNDGVGFADTFELSAFQPFFITVITPASIKRNEILFLHIMAFNYLNHDLPIRITLKDSDQFELVDLLGRKTVSYCISMNSTGVHIFEMKPRILGEMNVTVLAEVDSSYPGQCGPDVIVNRRDVVAKTIQVESEGYFKQTTKSSLLCINNTKSNISWTFQLPDNVIPETIKTRTIVTADLLGQTIENLDELLTIPTGCGEQIMSSLAPNLFILNYLNASHQLTAPIRQKTVRNLKMGYQRILNYLHRDGSFSAFGYHDPSGSMFLTAFVVRILHQAKSHIFTDSKIIAKSVDWILANQLENGCFNTMQHVFQDMGGTPSENNTAGLTSYVIISLLDAHISLPERVKTNARYCIRGYSNLDKYTLAISSYALLKLNWHEEAGRMLKRLVQIANYKENMMWWTTGRGDTLTSDIEITSYVLLSFVHYHTPENLAHASAIVRWLSSKQGPRGGFRSTQDTVVALDALTKYSQLIQRHRIDLEVNVVNNMNGFKFRIKSSDRLKTKKISFKNSGTVGEEVVSVVVEGEGCILARTVQEYYIKHLPLSGAFKLDFEARPVSSVDKCSMATLSPCFKYNGDDVQANMAILEVGLPSGYRADRASLYRLVDEEGASVRMFEEIGQKVVLYLTQLNHEQVCINFNINENTIVQGRTESTVKLYDYYKPECNVLQFYKLNECKYDINSSLILREIGGRARRSNKNGFKNVDYELEFPKGLESNQPSFIKPASAKINLNVNNSLINEHKMRVDRT